jgi:DNA-binding beta-propeller fold protein YncE
LGAYRTTIADLVDPVGVAVDAKDQIYVAEAGRHRIAVFDEKGKFVRAIGAKGSREGELLFPAGVCVSRDGEVFVSDGGNHRVCVYSPEGAFKRTWGQYGWSRHDLIAPAGIAVVGNRIYVADAGNDRVQIFNFKGKFKESIGSFGTEKGQYRRPVGVAVGRDGKLFVLDRDNSRVQVFDGKKKSFSEWGQWGPFPGMVEGPQGICLFDGQVFIADTLNHRVQVFDAAGKAAYQWGIHAFMPRDGQGKLHYPNAIAVAPSGRFAVVCEGFENRCQIFERMPPGQMPPTSPYVLNDPTANSHFGPSGSISGNLLALTEMEVQQVAIHNITTSPPVQIALIGGYGTKPGQFVRPAGVDLDARASRLIVGDAGNRRLQEFRLKQDPPGQLRFIPQMGQLVRTLEFDALRKTTEKLRDRPVIEPTVIRRGSKGRLYVLDAVQSLVVALDQNWNVEQIWLNPSMGRSEFSYPTDMAVDISRDNVFITDAGPSHVDNCEPNGRATFAFANKKLESPVGVVVGGKGSVFVSDEHSGRVFSFDVARLFDADYDGSEVASSWGGPGIGAGHFYRPRGIMVDEKGRVFVIDYGNHRCQIFSPDGKYLGVFGATYFIKPAQRGEGDANDDQ